MPVHQNLGERMAGGDPAFLQELVANKFLGKKTGKGFFLYDKKGKRQGLNEVVAPILAKYTAGRPDVCIEMPLYTETCIKFLIANWKSV